MNDTNDAKFSGSLVHSMKVKLFGMALLPLLLLAVITTVFATNVMKAGMQKESISSLRGLCISVRAAYAHIADGEYRQGENGDLYKGDYDITANTKAIDDFTKDTDADVTLFWGDTRKATSLKSVDTGKRIVGTQATDVVVNTTLKGGKDFSATHILINNKNYYAYYMPMKDSNGKVVGMFFAGQPSVDVDQYIASCTIKIVLIALLIVLLCAIYALFAIHNISIGIDGAQQLVTRIANGNLGAQIEEKHIRRKDEVGEISREISELQKRLVTVVTKIKTASAKLMEQSDSLGDKAQATNQTSGDIEKAIEEIAKGATSQADDVTSASHMVGDVGKGIEQIHQEVQGLNLSAESMEEAGKQETEIIKQLNEANQRTMEAIENIEKQVHTTNHSAQEIRDAVSLIDSIAEETNLLSLNASIEAARAGEQGRGFAVVASQIQKLAQQSSESAGSIEKTVARLIEESDRTVEVMDNTRAIAQEQEGKLKETSVHNTQVSKGIDAVKTNAIHITNFVTTCTKNKDAVLDSMEGLSAISEENAAACEETTASMQELNATMTLMDEAAQELKELANTLNEEIDYFKI
jgi:methyl-accepting chemotaxis protein